MGAQGPKPISSPPEQVTQGTQAGLARMRLIAKRAGIKGE